MLTQKSLYPHLLLFVLISMLWSCSEQVDYSSTRDSGMSDPSQIIIEDSDNDIFSIYDRLADEKPTTYFKEWKYSAKDNSILVDKNKNKEAALSFYNHKLWLGFDEHIAKENPKTMKYVSTHTFSKMEETGTYATRLTVNGKTFSGVLIGIHKGSGKKILEVQYYDGLRIGTFNVWTNLGRLYTKSFKNKVKVMDIEAVRKPVVYLYPEKEEAINVKVNFNGKITHSYPSYNQEKGWQVTATPEGHLVDKATGKSYPYLFWEGKSLTQYTLDKGFVVKGKESVTFLEEKLARLGLNRREATDFITYWMPALEQNAYNLIHFSTDEYTQNAPLSITPSPQTLIRVFMVYRPLEAPIDIAPQKLKSAQRKGFTVVEWGGKKAAMPLE